MNQHFNMHLVGMKNTFITITWQQLMPRYDLVSPNGNNNSSNNNRNNKNNLSPIEALLPWVSFCGGVVWTQPELEVAKVIGGNVHLNGDVIAGTVPRFMRNTVAQDMLFIMFWIIFQGFVISF